MDPIDKKNINSLNFPEQDDDILDDEDKFSEHSNYVSAITPRIVEQTIIHSNIDIDSVMDITKHNVDTLDNKMLQAIALPYSSNPYSVTEFTNNLLKTNSFSKKYVECLQIIGTKSDSIFSKEIEAINKIKKSFNLEVPIQKRLHELEDYQLLMFLPTVYVEAAHKLNPLIAYNSSDLTAEEIQLNKESATKEEHHSDDNINMLLAYSKLLQLFSSYLFKIGNEKEKISLLKTLMYELSFDVSSLSKAVINKFFENNESACFPIPSNLIYRSSIFSDEGKPFRLLKLKKFDGIELLIEERGANFIINGVEVNIQDKLILIERCASMLISSLEQKKVTDIIAITVELMYMHLFPDGNARLSQVLRDCCMLHIDQAPFSSLTHMSQYACIDINPDIEHFKFMQEITLMTLNSIEYKIFSNEIANRNGVFIQSLLQKCNPENVLINWDIETFKLIELKKQKRINKS